MGWNPVPHRLSKKNALTSKFSGFSQNFLAVPPLDRFDVVETYENAEVLCGRNTAQV